MSFQKNEFSLKCEVHTEPFLTWEKSSVSWNNILYLSHVLNLFLWNFLWHIHLFFSFYSAQHIPKLPFVATKSFTIKVLIFFKWSLLFYSPGMYGETYNCQILKWTWKKWYEKAGTTLVNNSVWTMGQQGGSVGKDTLHASLETLVPLLGPIWRRKYQPHKAAL